MNQHDLTVFRMELERQCSFAAIAHTDLVRLLRSSPGPGVNIAEWNARIFYAIQAFLAAAGNVSKMLWPQSTKAHPRGDFLRKTFGVSDASALKSRTFRNHFEHFDERLDEWAVQSRDKNISDGNIGPPGFMTSGFAVTDQHRNFDTQNFAVVFRGEMLPLVPLIEELHELYKKVRT